MQGQFPAIGIAPEGHPMDRLDLRAAARAVARASRTSFNARNDAAGQRVRSPRAAPSLAETAADEERARRACAPMGALHSIVVSRNARNRTRTFYVIVPDPALHSEYERLGLALEPGCKVLVDAARLRPLAVLATTDAGEPRTPSRQESSPVGFNPSFDLPDA
jgi:hypothetical protein